MTFDRDIYLDGLLLRLDTESTGGSDSPPIIEPTTTMDNDDSQFESGFDAYYLDDSGYRASGAYHHAH